LSVQVNLTNFDTLSNCFECLCEQYPEAVSQALVNVAQNILATAQTLVPVRTGYLKSTLQIVQTSNFQISIKATAPYAFYVEFGTRKMTARLFITRAVQEHINDFAAEIEQQILDLLQG
jgi:HK97 gp10 family phage protein